MPARSSKRVLRGCSMNWYSASPIGRPPVDVESRSLRLPYSRISPPTSHSTDMPVEIANDSRNEYPWSRANVSIGAPKMIGCLTELVTKPLSSNRHASPVSFAPSDDIENGMSQSSALPSAPLRKYQI
jgi:hypothetical protein